MKYFVPPTNTAKKSKFRSLPFQLMESFVQKQWRDTAQDQGLASGVWTFGFQKVDLQQQVPSM